MHRRPSSIWFAALALVAAIAVDARALGPTLQGIQVVQGGVVLGTIQPYHGALSGLANYNYVQPSGAPINGPDPAAREGRLFFYEGPDGLHFNVIFNDEGSGSATINWTIAVAGSTLDPVVQFSDDPVPPANVPELQEVAATNVFTASWNYEARVDGGVIGPLGGAAWMLAINPVAYGSSNGNGITALRAFGETGRPISLNTNIGASGNIEFIAVAVPEPNSILLAALAVAGLPWRRAAFGVGRTAATWHISSLTIEA